MITLLHVCFFQTWLRVVAGGVPGQPWPVGRYNHCAVSLSDADGDPSDPALMVWGGGGEGHRVLSDGWVFRVNPQQWQKVRLIFPCHIPSTMTCG